MQLTNLESLVPRLIYMETVGSTNTELTRLVANSAAEYPNYSTLVASHQSDGRGRLQRPWESVAGRSLAMSVFLNEIPQSRISLIPLVAALAVVDSLNQQGVGAKIKWPNDVLIEDQKISGILAELVPAGVVLGIGLNLAPIELETATSISELGLESDFETQARLLLKNLINRIGELHGSKQDVRGLLAELTRTSATLGQQVNAILPGGETMSGLAIAIESDGMLVMESNGSSQLISSADIVHLRKAST